MSRQRRWFLVGAGSLLTALVVVAWLEPNQILVGILHGDDFFNGRPTRYWREILRQEGLAGRVSDETIALFKTRAAAVPVLRACSQDSDRNVRWPAVLLLGTIARFHSHAALPALRAALKDDDVQIRLQAILALHVLQGNALSAGPDLVERLNDPDAQVSFVAERALWDVNKKLALKQGGWQTFVSARWNFAVAFPGPPVEEQKPNMVAGELITHSFAALQGVSHLAVAVTEYPTDLFKGTDDDRLDAARDILPVMLHAKLVNEKPYRIGSIKGREFTFEKTTEADGSSTTTIIKNRVFWVQQRHYNVQAVYNAEYSVVRAIEYFLDSFEYRTDAKMP